MIEKIIYFKISFLGKYIQFRENIIHKTENNVLDKL